LSCHKLTKNARSHFDKMAFSVRFAGAQGLHKV
jgi:hypothetical protein